MDEIIRYVWIIGMIIVIIVSSFQLMHDIFEKLLSKIGFKKDRKNKSKEITDKDS
ncbi:MAG: hypothetical protein PHH30_01205 [Bacteroidales bacterium]|nr:hypothetical protein [Bacteroidales bacterium]